MDGLIKDNSEGLDGDWINGGVVGKGSNLLLVIEDSEGAADADEGMGVVEKSRWTGTGPGNSVETSELGNDKEMTDEDTEVVRREVHLGSKDGNILGDSAVEAISNGILTLSTSVTDGSSTSNVRLRGVPNWDGMVSRSDKQISAV